MKKRSKKLLLLQARWLKQTSLGKQKFFGSFFQKRTSFLVLRVVGRPACHAEIRDTTWSTIGAEPAQNCGLRPRYRLLWGLRDRLGRKKGYWGVRRKTGGMTSCESGGAEEHPTLQVFHVSTLGGFSRPLPIPLRGARDGRRSPFGSVSYTHLTLPTIYSV